MKTTTLILLLIATLTATSCVRSMSGGYMPSGIRGAINDRRAHEKWEQRLMEDEEG